jgi:hypothetical protein
MAYTDMTYGGMGAIAPNALYESEEERRQRLARERQAMMQGQGPVMPQPQVPAPTPTMPQPQVPAPTAEMPTPNLGSGIQIMNRGPNYDNLLSGALVNERINSRLQSDPNAPPDVRATAMDFSRQRAENQRR